MQKHLELASQNASLEGESWMTQWSDEEELLTDYVQQFSGRRAEKRIAAFGLVVVTLAALWANVGKRAGSMASVATEKVHIV